MICLSMLVLPVILLVRLTSSLPLLHSLAGQDTLRNAFLTEEPGEVPSARVPRQPPVTLPPITLPPTWGIDMNALLRRSPGPAPAWPTLGPVTLAPSWGLPPATTRTVTLGYWNWHFNR